MSYQVFARKYRPQIFSEVVGQDHVVQTLRNAIEQNRLAQAYLLVGPRGIGKTTTARILAKALCCETGPTATPCGVCDACREIAAGTSLDVIEIDGASNNKVESVRELIENARYLPARGKYKIYLIDEVHMLTTQAFNALLKTLEEPPPHVKFIFATTEPDKVLATILSRCQRFDLRRIPAPLIAAHLQHISRSEGITLSEDAASAVARGAQGGLRDAESMLDQLVSFCGTTIAAEDVRGVFGFTSPETVARFAGAILAQNAPEALDRLTAESEAGRDLLRFLGDLIGHLRNLLVYQVNPGSVADEHDEVVLEMIRTQSAAVDASRLLQLIDHFATAEGRIKWAPDKKLHFEIAVIKAAQMLGEATLDEVIDELAAIRRGDPSAAAPAGLRGPAPAARAAAPATPARSTAAPAAAPTPAKAAPRISLAPAPAEPPARGETPAPAPTPASATSPPAAETADEIWQRVLGEVRAKRPLIRAWMEMGRALDLVGDQLRVGFPTEQKIVVESLAVPPHRPLLEEIMSRHAGRPLKLKMEVRDDLPAEAPPTPAPTPAAEPAQRTPTPKSPPPKGGAAAGKADPMVEFRNDPQIQSALEIFDAEIIEIKTKPRS